MTDDLGTRWIDALRAEATRTPADAPAWAAIRARADRAEVVVPASEPRRHRALAVAAAVLVVLVGGGLFAVTRGDDRRQPVLVSATTTTTAPVGGSRYRAQATVLESDRDMPAMQPHGPELCLGGTFLSLPPQCSGPPITNWDWTKVQFEEVGGVRWGDYAVVGTFDGERFTLTQDPTAPTTTPHEPAVSFDTPCPEPPGGWRVTDRTHVTPADLEAFTAAARADSDFSLLWVDHRAANPPGGPAVDVYTVAFTGDIGRHTDELRALWSGPTCVVRAERGYNALHAAQGRIEDDFAHHRLAGLQMLSLGPDATHDRLNLTVEWAPAGTEAMLLERYGVPVRVHTALQPVP